MHVRELVEVAGIVAHSGPLVIARAHLLAPAPLEQYWAVAKCRCENWHRSLKADGVPVAADQDSPAQLPLTLRATIEEIFVSEILTRVWTTVLVARDRRFRSGVDEPVARSVFESHMEARRRALKLLAGGGAISSADSAALNQVRRRAERWSDVLVGGLQPECRLTEFAVDASRALDFAEDLADRRSRPGGRHAWQMTLLSLRRAFGDSLSEHAASPDSNARLTASILGCFPGELFDSTGLLHSLWMTRLTATASDAQGLVSELLATSCPTPAVYLRRRSG